MSDYNEMPVMEDANALINSKLRQVFDGRIVRKDLTKKIKEGANVPVYVLEFLLGQYCSSDDPEIIKTGVENVKRILADNYVRPDEAQKILSILRQRGTYTVIDKITVNLNMKKDTYEAEFSNLGIKGIPITEDYPAKYDRLLCGGIWCIVQLEYEFIEEEKNMSPIAPLSPSCAILLKQHGKMLHQDMYENSFIEIAIGCEERIAHLNLIALRRQISEKTGYIVCPKRSVLNDLLSYAGITPRWTNRKQIK